MSKHPHQPYNSDCLTEPEQALQREQERKNCVTCEWLGKQRRGGTRECERGNDPGPVLAGEVICEDHMPIRAGMTATYETIRRGN